MRPERRRDAVSSRDESLRARSERGQGLVEYSLILSLVSIFAIALLVLLGTNLVGLLQVILDTLLAV